MEQTISLENFFHVLSKHLRIIIISTVMGLLLASIVTFFIMTPKYQASVDILVNRKQDNSIENQLNDQQADVQMINTYKDIITKSVILDPVKNNLTEKLGYRVSLAQLHNMISVSNQPNSQVFTVTVEDTDASRAATIANIIAETFKIRVKDILAVNNVSIIAKATRPRSTVSPKKSLNLAIGLVLGLLIGMSLAVFLEVTDHNVKSTEFLTEELGLTNLGMVSHYRDEKDKKRRRRRRSVKSINRPIYQSAKSLNDDQSKAITNSTKLKVKSAEPVQSTVKTASSQITAPQASSRASRLRTNDDLSRRQSQKRI